MQCNKAPINRIILNLKKHPDQIFTRFIIYQHNLRTYPTNILYTLYTFNIANKGLQPAA